MHGLRRTKANIYLCSFTQAERIICQFKGVDEINIQKILIDKLVSAKYNPRKDLQPDDAEYIKLRRSLEAFGYIEPLIINADMTVIGGHQRLKVLRELGYTEVDCVVVDLDKKQEKALNVALNKISGEWDFEKLSDLFDTLRLDDFPLELTGFETFEIEPILHSESLIEDLLNSDFVSNSADSSEFAITFIFPIEYKPDIEKYIKENGKISLVDTIINKVKVLI